MLNKVYFCHMIVAFCQIHTRLTDVIFLTFPTKYGCTVHANRLLGDDICQPITKSVDPDQTP